MTAGFTFPPKYPILKPDLIAPKLSNIFKSPFLDSYQLVAYRR